MYGSSCGWARGGCSPRWRRNAMVADHEGVSSVGPTSGPDGSAPDFPDSSLDWLTMGPPTGPITEVIAGSGPQAGDRIGVVTVQSASSFPASAGPTRAALATDLVTCPE